MEPSRISPHEVLKSWSINTVYHLLVKYNKGEGRGLIYFPHLKKGGGLFESGSLIEDLW